MSLELDIFNKLMKQRKENDHVDKNTWSCDGCVFEPPSSCDGKPCGACEPSDPFMSCYSPKVDEDGPMQLKGYEIMECKTCPLKSKCSCGYSYGNSACITLRNEYAEAMTNKSNTLYDRQRSNVT